MLEPIFLSIFKGLLRLFPSVYQRKSLAKLMNAKSIKIYVNKIKIRIAFMDIDWTF